MKWDELQKDCYYSVRGDKYIVLFKFNGRVEDYVKYNRPGKRIHCYSAIYIGLRTEAYMRNTYVMAFLDKEFKEITEDDYLKLMKLRKMFESAVFPLIKMLVKN